MTLIKPKLKDAAFLEDVKNLIAIFGVGFISAGTKSS